jgi:hypothetical protein
MIYLKKSASGYRLAGNVLTAIRCVVCNDLLEGVYRRCDTPGRISCTQVPRHESLWSAGRSWPRESRGLTQQVQVPAPGPGIVRAPYWSAAGQEHKNGYSMKGVVRDTSGNAATDLLKCVPVAALIAITATTVP